MSSVFYRHEMNNSVIKSGKKHVTKESIIDGGKGLSFSYLEKIGDNFYRIIAKQSEAVDYCDKRLKTLDDRKVFYADDEIGWFFEKVKEIQEALNEFRLR